MKRTYDLGKINVDRNGLVVISFTPDKADTRIKIKVCYVSQSYICHYSTTERNTFSFFLPNTNAQAHVIIHISMFVTYSNMAFILRCNLRSVSFC